MPNTDNYFQAGIIVFNIKQMNIENTYEKLMTAMKSRSFWFLDQDIMNKVFYDRVYYLPPTWNVYHGNGNTNDFFPNLKFSTYMQFLESRKEPKMIHFAGENKPWDTPFVDFFDNFMSYVYNTPWQKEVYDRLSHRGTTISLVTNNNDILFQTKVKRKIMPYFNRFAPIGSKRRQVIAKNYYKIRRVLLG